MKEELADLLSRDLISRRAIETTRNWLLRDEILATAVPAYVDNKNTHETG